MKFENVFIESLGYHLPENVVTSEDLERELAPLYEKLKLPYGRLEMMSGIGERRFWEKGIFPSEVSSIAGTRALEKSSIDKNDIGTLICASVCRDFLEPATATVIHHNLELPQDCMVFDISNACLGVMNGMITVANQIESGQIKAGLVVAGENGGPLVRATIENLLSDPEPNRSKIKTAFASLTIGSAAVAVLLVHRDFSENGHRLLGGVSRADTSHNHLCRGTEDTGMGLTAQPLMETDAETLMQEGIRLGGKTWEIFKKEMGWSGDEVNRSFCHQVGSLHRKLMLETFQLDPANDFTTLETLGNTGSAALPVTLAKGEEAGFLSTGDKIALLGIGSGLNCMMLGVEW
ncbi:MAG: 3-oxoacyl-ACP synthase III [Candidatus Nitronauta litoralis]|uniref:3-oxoacyl-ACP synthase III n=1 Tax=Candidatus Nitronauta litoralis TaxID=2705533 RepID=A0A7T0G1Y8_9BACT|nr:MAG: 3-oxoacyl-ACP synthase III [Candidatus Nitronauta litoralis]